METLERGFWFSYTPEEQEEEAGYVRSALQVKTILWWDRNLKSITESQHWTACRQQNAIQSSEWTIASLDYDQAMSGPTGSGQRYFADQMLTLNEDCVFVVHDGRNLSCSERKSYSAYGTTPPPPATVEEPGGPTEPDDCAGGVATGVLFGGRGHTNPLS